MSSKVLSGNSSITADRRCSSPFSHIVTALSSSSSLSELASTIRWNVELCNKKMVQLIIKIFESYVHVVNISVIFSRMEILLQYPSFHCKMEANFWDSILRKKGCFLDCKIWYSQPKSYLWILRAPNGRACHAFRMGTSSNTGTSLASLYPRSSTNAVRQPRVITATRYDGTNDTDNTCNGILLL